MPNLISQDVNQDRAILVASNMASCTFTKERILAEQQTLAGSDPVTTKQQVSRNIALYVSDTLGADQLAPDQMLLDYDQSTGAILDLTFLS